MKGREYYENKAVSYAERYGIIEYRVSKNEMIYYQTYPTGGTYDVRVNLDTMKETRSKLNLHLKRRVKAGVYNV